jgi:GGDEF domain-containing protein
MQRITQVKRPVDMLGHFEQADFAMLLPNSNASAGGAAATRIIEVLSEAPLTSDIDTRSLWSAYGVATIPEDCQEMDKLLQAAKRARDQARHGREKIILARGVAPEENR